jgi:hypothetical protein
LTAAERFGRMCLPDFSMEGRMPDELSSEVAQELRQIRTLLKRIAFFLALIVLILAINFAMQGYLRWAETHYR